MGWVVCSDAVVESCDAVLVFVVTASRCICDAVSSHCREILEQCWCRVCKVLDDWEDDRYRNANLVNMEYLVKVSKRRAFWSLNEDILKITILKTNKPYPSRKIQRIHACTHQRPQRKLVQYAISREDQYAGLEI
ncbi:hypothetical protein Tco_0679427 [Tanacetum coccineum]|uniref:Uncharacterized protein n=1 Tax=Tanacetum coccineum TaxID=301880 RepID=A0ABQ4XIS5_9ASTR